MALAPGTRLGPYELLTPIGAGGMGIVWRARDTTLGREVAVKLLPDEFSWDRDRLARFEREARLLASLNHPAIAVLYGLHEIDGVRFLAMELVPGEDLAARLARAPLSVAEALAAARQIAEGIEAAHESGVIHRDLKPANIQITPEGRVKLLDFGLARAFQPDASSGHPSMSPTVTSPGTLEGVILGTAAYMSPEQAKGKAADRRADIWAFGAVLFELLGGGQLFRGETISETLAVVMMKEPAWDLLPPDVPAAVRRLLRRCLEKDARRRLRDIGEARILLDDVVAGRIETEPDADAAPFAQSRRGMSAWLLLTAGIALGSAMAGTAAWLLRPAPAAPPVRRFEIPIEDLPTPGIEPVISPDGRKILFRSGDRLWVRALDEVQPFEIPGSKDARMPFWSPDARAVGFAVRDRLWKYHLGAKESTAIAEVGGADQGAPNGAAWGVDGTIVFARAPASNELRAVSDRGGDPRTVLAPDPETEADFHRPSPLPGGKGIVFLVHRKKIEKPGSGGGHDTLAVWSPRGRKTVLQLAGENLGRPVYSPTGHILYERRSNNAGIWAVPFSLASLEVTGEPFLVVPGGASPSVSADGTLVHTRGTSGQLLQLVWVNRAGQVKGPIGQPQESLRWLAVSPDGTRVAVSANENDNLDIWVHDVGRGTKIRLTSAETPEYSPTWSPDGARVFFNIQSEILEVPADGTGEPRKLATGWGQAASRDGRFLLFTRPGGDATGQDLFYLDLAAGGEPAAFLQTPEDESFPRPSPDGRYVAYVSDESGRQEVYLKRFPSGEGEWPVSVDGGSWHTWSPNGDELFFVHDGTLLSVPVRTSPVLTLGAPKALFSERDTQLQITRRGYGVAPDGRFVMVQAANPDEKGPSIVVVENWFAEFQDRE